MVERQADCLRVAVARFADSRTDDYFRKMGPRTLEIMIGIAVDVLQIPAARLPQEALEADRALAKTRERLGISTDAHSTLAEMRELDEHMQEFGHEMPVINRTLSDQLRQAIAEKRARKAVTEAFHNNNVTSGVGSARRNAPVDFCWQAVRSALPLLDEANS